MWGNQNHLMIFVNDNGGLNHGERNTASCPHQNKVSDLEAVGPPSAS